MSQNGILYFLGEVIREAGTNREIRVPTVPIVSGWISTSTAFHKNWSVASVLDVASWCSNSVFASFYLRDCILSMRVFVL